MMFTMIDEIKCNQSWLWKWDLSRSALQSTGEYEYEREHHEWIQMNVYFSPDKNCLHTLLFSRGQRANNLQIRRAEPLPIHHLESIRRIDRFGRSKWNWGGKGSFPVTNDTELLSLIPGAIRQRAEEHECVTRSVARKMPLWQKRLERVVNK